MDDSSLRILHVVNDFLPFTRAGTEHYLAQLMAGQQRQGLQPTVLHLTPAGSAAPASPHGLGTVPDYAIVPAPYEQAPAFMLHVPAEHRTQVENPRVAEAVGRWLQARARSHPVDVIHLHSLIGFSASLLDAVPDTVPVVMTMHDFWFFCATAILVRGDGTICPGPESEIDCARCLAGFSDRAPCRPEDVPLRNALHRKAFARLDLAICPSHFSRRHYVRHGFPGPRILRAPLGMEPVPVAPLEATAVGKAGAGATPVGAGAGGEIRFAYLGGICWFKGLDLAIHAFLALKDCSARLDVYGAPSNLEYFHVLEAQAKLWLNVVFHGKYTRQDLGRILAGVDVVILPSRMETYSFVAREALSAGVPVIAADCGALPEIIRHQRNGLLFRSGDAAHLAWAIRRVLDEPDLLPRLRAGIGPVLSLDEDATRLRELYRDLLTARQLPC